MHNLRPCGRVFSIRHIIAVVLLALWMPATQHCNLEAAGLISAYDSCLGAGNPCSPDGCRTIEGLTDKPSADLLLKVPAPDLLVCSCLLCLQLAYRDLRIEPLTPVIAAEKPQAWVPIWHFVRRAAPLSRAPSVLV
jgi:hypothetical protein